LNYFVSYNSTLNNLSLPMNDFATSSEPNFKFTFQIFKLI
jgi:hypothetical protein